MCFHYLAKEEADFLFEFYYHKKRKKASDVLNFLYDLHTLNSQLSINFSKYHRLVNIQKTS